MSLAESSPCLTIGSIEILLPPLKAAARAIADRSLTGAVHLCNAYSMALAGESESYAAYLGKPGVNLPDGMPLVWLARRHGHREAERVYGPDLMEATLDIGQSTGARHYLYGSTPEVLEKLEKAIVHRWPDACVVASESPPFRDISDDELRATVQRAEDAGATIVWVGMGTPKQDALVSRMANMSGLAFIAIGAAFDFLGGTKKQAPRWMMPLGLEWVYRLVTEPRRLWRRYIVYNARFVRLVLTSRRQISVSAPANR